MTGEQLKEKYKSTIPLLMSYMHMGILSRSFMLQKHGDELNNLKKENKQNKEYEITEFLIYRELFERVCLAIEDFSIIVYALSCDLEDFQKNVVSQPNPKSILTNFDEKTLDTILKYCDLDHLSPSDRELIQNIRSRNASIIKEFVSLLVEFIDFNWVVFTKIKHGNTIFTPYEKIKIDNMETFVSPVVYNKKHPEQVKMLLLNSFIYSRLQLMFNSLTTLMYQFCNTNYEYICSGETGTFLGLCFAEISEEEMAHYKEIVKKYSLHRHRYDIKAIITGDIDRKLINEVFDFYRRCNLGFQLVEQ